MADSKFEKWGRAARDLYVKQNKSIEEIADLLDISRKTIGEWCADGKWVQQRKRHQMRSAEIADFAEDILFAKMQQLRDTPPDQIDSGILDGLAKLMGQIQDLKKYSNLLDKAVDVMEYFLPHCKKRFDGEALAAVLDAINDFLTTLETTT